MFIDKNSLIVNGVSLGQYILEAKYSYNKLWTNGGRNLAGTMTGTLVGVFPKIIVQFAPLTKSQLEIIVPILDAPSQSVTYYDPNKKQNVTMTTYTGDYEITDKNIITNGKTNEGFNVSFIAIRRRT